MEQVSKKYDLVDRTGNFGKAVIRFCKTLRQDVISTPLISQVVRSATSIGANYAEATNASSRKDFRNKVFVSKKEAQETKHWLAMLEEYNSQPNQELHGLQKENQELLMILQKICSSLDK